MIIFVRLVILSVGCTNEHKHIAFFQANGISVFRNPLKERIPIDLIDNATNLDSIKGDA